MTRHPVTDGDPKTTAFEMVDGRMFDPLNPDPNIIDIEMIATVLANSCRFNGHVPVENWYSNAQHSVLVAYLAPDDMDSQRMAILHDADETLGLPDMMTMLKPSFPSFVDCQAAIGEAIAIRFDLCREAHARIKPADRQAFLLEHEQIKCGSEDHRNAWSAGLAVPDGIRILPLGQVEAKSLFLDAVERVLVVGEPINEDWMSSRPGFLVQREMEISL